MKYTEYEVCTVLHTLNLNANENNPHTNILLQSNLQESEYNIVEICEAKLAQVSKVADSFSNEVHISFITSALVCSLIKISKIYLYLYTELRFRREYK